MYKIYSSNIHFSQQKISHYTETFMCFLSNNYEAVSSRTDQRHYTHWDCQLAAGPNGVHTANEPHFKPTGDNINILVFVLKLRVLISCFQPCLLYTSDAADDC